MSIPFWLLFYSFFYSNSNDLFISVCRIPIIIVFCRELCHFK